MKDTKMHNIIIVVLLVLFIASLLGFFNPGGPKLSNGILGAIQQNQAAGGILFDENGKLTLVDKDGKPGQECTFAGGKKPCKGFNGGQVMGMDSITLLKTKGSICFTIINSQGVAIQICI